MVPRFGALTTKTLARRAWKTNCKSTPVIAIIISGIFLLTLVIWLFRNISNLQCYVKFSSIHSNCFGSHQTQKNVPRQKVTFRYLVVIPVLAGDQYLDDCRGQHDELVWGAIGLVIAKWTLLCFPQWYYINQKPFLTNFSLHSRWEQRRERSSVLLPLTPSRTPRGNIKPWALFSMTLSIL